MDHYGNPVRRVLKKSPAVAPADGRIDRSLIHRRAFPSLSTPGWSAIHLSQPSAVRQLGPVTCVLIGLTTIVGGGIFALPPILAAATGPLSFLSFVGAAVVAIFIGLMTAEAAGTTEATGGAYQYARLAFGAPTGFFVAWLGWVNNVIAWSGISIGLVRLLDLYEPGLGSGTTGKLIATGEILLFGAINMMGAKPGASVSNVITWVKLAPLVFFIIISFLVIDFSRFRGGWDTLAAAGAGGFAVTVFRCFFAASGFENIGVIAGEVENPRRAIPKAVMIAILASSTLYAFLQIGAVGASADLASLMDRGKATTPALPLVAGEVGRVLGGGNFGSICYFILLFGAVTSMTGLCAGIAVVAPRYLYAMAGDGFLPPVVVSTTRGGTPAIAIGLATVVAASLVWGAGWLELLDANVLFAMVQHTVTILATWKLRRVIAKNGRFIAPGGPVVPLIALALIFTLVYLTFQPAPPGMAALIEPVSSKQFVALGIVLSVAASVAIASKLIFRVPTRPPGGGA